MIRLTRFITAIVMSLAISLPVAPPSAFSAVPTPAAAREDGFSPPMGTYLNVDAGFGTAEITFLADGRYTYGDDGGVSAEGTYKVAGHRIVFIEYRPADAACLHQRGQYTWAFAGKTLALKEVDDPCPTRQYDWGFGEWIEER